MDIRAALAAPFVLLFLSMFLLQRWNSRRHHTGKRLGFFPSTAVMGTALLSIQTLVQPHMEQVIEQRLQEPVEDDEEGGPDDPVAHLHRQARKFRRGEVDRFTAIVPVVSNPRTKGEHQA